ncbi:MAG: ferrous iron transporter B [Bacteroidetes bacterium]|nr:ferrous iron transporter B [Bacteroidota bacterium]
MRPDRTIAVVGTPNTGKSTLFNVLTGLQQHVGNYPGVTVEPLLGTVTHDGTSITLIDLPGTYSLASVSEDEKMTVDVLTGVHPSIPRPNAILFVMNASNPEKCLVLYSQLAALGLPMLVCITMIDTVKAAGGGFDDISMYHEFGVRILPVVGSKGLGIGDVKAALVTEHDARVPTVVVPPEATIEERFIWARDVERRFWHHGKQDLRTAALDRVLLHPILGTVIFIVVMVLFFQSIFWWASPLMDGIDAAMSAVREGIATSMGDTLLSSFISNGLIAGVGSVIVFLPQILILNVFITILEECGYLARAAFLVDRFMGLFGLQGRSFIPLLGSFACAIPGIMSARIIPSYRDRMATIMATPFMTCSARLPVYALLISACIPATQLWGVLSVQGVVLTALYVAGALSGLLIALLLKRTMFKGGVVTFLMEFPPYRMPSWKSLWITVYNRSKDFLKTAGTVIVVFSVILWVFTALPRTEIPANTPPLQAAQMQMEGSYAASVGKAIQPLFAPLGFDWKITLGVLSSYAARETFVSAMGQIYAADVSESDVPLRTVLHTTIPLATGLSILAFYVYALQCVSTMAIMKRETGSWKWPAIAFAMTFVLAYTASFLVFTIAQ